MIKEKVNNIRDIKTVSQFVEFFGIEKVLNNNVIDLVNDFELIQGSITNYYDMVTGDEITEEEYNDLIEYENRDYDDFETYDNEIYQYYIINPGDVGYFTDYTDEIILYSESLDMYLWGVTHYGTSWDFVPISLDLSILDRYKID